VAAVIDYLDNAEIGVCLKINRLGRRASVRHFFAAVSKLADWYVWVAMGAVLLAIQGTSAGPDLLQFLLTAVVGIGVYKALKGTLVRERPFVHDGTIDCGAVPLDQYSFPSGHTLHAVAFTILFTHAEPALFAVCAPFAVLVALSRIILGLHYPSDVVVGAALGASIATTSLYLFG